MPTTDLQQPLSRRKHRVSAVVVLVAMIGFTAACGSGSDTPEESTTTTTTTTEAPLSPTEKAPNPNSPNDPFTPPVVAPQPTLDQDRDDYGQ